MATRNGKANAVQSRIGAASPRVVRFRSGGLASVWDWRNDAESDAPGVPVACDIDCAVHVTAHVSVQEDSALRIDGAYITAADTSIVTMKLVDIVCDQRLYVYQVSAFATDGDFQAVVLNSRSALLDEQVIVSNSLLKGFDIAWEIIGAISKQLDVALQSCAPRTVYCDVLISVPEPTLFMADTLVGVSGMVSSQLDQSIIVWNSIERRADCLQNIWGVIERRSDARIIVGKTVRLEADATWRIDNIRVIKCDIAAVISCILALESDLEIRTSARLADADLMQRIYGLLIEESHVIQV